MKFLADENVPFSILQFLRELGYNLITVESFNKQQTSDENIIALAKKHNLTIITLDFDFAYLYHFSEEKFPVIILKFKPFYIDKIKNILKDFLSKQKEIIGLAILSERGVRLIK